MGGTERLQGLGRNVIQYGQLVIVLASLSTNVLLAVQVRSLKTPARPGSGLLQIGQSVPPIIVENSAGRVVSVEPTQAKIPTLLYVLRPTCGWCRRNLANMSAIIQQSAGRYRVVLLSLEPGDFSDYGGRENVFVVTADTRRALKLGATPQTLVVSPEGKVLQNWTGAYGGNAKQVEAALHVVLPGLLPANMPTNASFH